MAIAFDNSTDLGNNGGSTNSLTTSYTVTGSNPVLLVGVVGDTFGGHDDITGITYNGVSLTFVNKIVSGTTSPNRFVYLYQLTGPTTGAHNVVVSCTNNHYLLAGAASYTGCAQSGQPDNSGATISSAASNNYLSSLTPNANNCWMICFAGGYDGGSAPGASTGATRRSFDGSFGTWGFFDSNSAITPAASYSMTTTYTSVTNPIVHLMASIAPPSTTTVQPIICMFG